jgi:hypothetical protein
MSRERRNDPTKPKVPQREGEDVASNPSKEAGIATTGGKRGSDDLTDLDHPERSTEAKDKLR